MWVHFRLIKMKPKVHGMYNRLMLSIMKDDFQELISKHYKKIVKNRFYNSFMHDNYRENNMMTSYFNSSNNSQNKKKGISSNSSQNKNFQSNISQTAALPITHGNNIS